MIDDEPSAESYAAALAAAHPRLEIEPLQLRDPNEIVSYIERVRPDGLLIDLVLSRSKGKAEEHFKIEGTAITQEFRTRSNKLLALTIPMASLSYKSRRETIVGQDKTSSDLFDVELSKSDISNYAKEIAVGLVDLASGYKMLSGLRTLNSDKFAIALGLVVSDYDLLDFRVDRDLRALSERPVHNIAHFILHSLLPFSGPLIDTEVLAIRLGVDTSGSGKNWDVLQKKFPKKARYSGVFAKSHDRWWMTFIGDWWSSLKDAPGSLPILTAQERVDFLKFHFKLRGLKAIENSTKSPGYRFWTVCERTGLPVDPQEGYAIIDDDQMRSWHDKRFLSRSAALRYVQDTIFESGEVERLEKFGRKRPR